MVIKVTLPKIDPNTPPEEQVGQMYRAVEALFKAVNEQIIPVVRRIEEQIEQNTASVNQISDIIR